jgi:hypothetical protein
LAATLYGYPIVGVSGLFGSSKESHHEIGDVVVDRVSGLPFRIVDTVMLNDIPHARVRCQAPGNSATKTIALGALEMTFSVSVTTDTGPRDFD